MCNLCLILIPLIHSVLSHYLPLDGMPDFNLYPATKHASLALTDTVRGEIAKIKAPIRITVRCNYVLNFFLLFFLCYIYK